MSFKNNLIRAGALGAVITALTAGAAFAAVATSSVNVRTGPSTSYRVLDTLYPGEHVAVTDRSGVAGLRSHERAKHDQNQHGHGDARHDVHDDDLPPREPAEQRADDHRSDGFADVAAHPMH